MNFPVIKMKMLYHVGELNCQPAPHSRDSQEGPCLSVSKVPGAWRRIAKLGEAPLWELRKPGAAFLNMLSLSAAATEAIVQWGYQNGYAVEGTAWVAEFHPEEDDEGDVHTRTCLHPTFEQSVRECGEVGEADEMDVVQSRFPKQMPFATQKLIAYAEQDVELLMVVDMLALAYAEQVLDLDGLFWDGKLDVYNYLAPRGGILRSKLSSWTITKARTGANEPGEGEY